MKLFTLATAATLLLSPTLSAGGVIVPDPLYQLNLTGTTPGGTGVPAGSPWSIDLTFSAPPVPINAVGLGALNVTSITDPTFSYPGTPVSIIGSNAVTTSSLNFTTSIGPSTDQDSLSVQLAIQSATADGLISLGTINDSTGAMIGLDGTLNPITLNFPASGSGSVSGPRLLLDEGPIFLQVSSLTITPIPEPHSALLAILGLTTLAFRRRRR